MHRQRENSLLAADGGLDGRGDRQFRRVEAAALASLAKKLVDELSWQYDLGAAERSLVGV